MTLIIATSIYIASRNNSVVIAVIANCRNSIVIVYKSIVISDNSIYAIIRLKANTAPNSNFLVLIRSLIFY